MEFDVGRVCTMFNADKLSIGDSVYVANDLRTLKALVEQDESNDVLERVLTEDHKYRFVIRDDVNADDSDSVYTAYAFAYLIALPLKWQDLKIGDVIRNKVSGIKYLVTMQDEHELVEKHIGITKGWLYDSDISNFEKVGLC